MTVHDYIEGINQWLDKSPSNLVGIGRRARLVANQSIEASTFGSVKTFIITVYNQSYYEEMADNKPSQDIIIRVQKQIIIKNKHDEELTWKRLFRELVVQMTEYLQNPKLIDYLVKYGSS